MNPDVLECHGAPPRCDRAALSRRIDPLLCRNGWPLVSIPWPRLLQSVRDQDIGPYQTDCRPSGSWDGWPALHVFFFPSRQGRVPYPRTEAGFRFFRFAATRDYGNHLATAIA